MLEFMIIGPPRSGTTWAANWLSTDATHCLHDPLFEHHVSELDLIQSAKVLGISCTGVPLYPQWLQSHPARKVVLHRPMQEVNASLAAMGLPEVDERWSAVLNKIEGRHYHWRALFDAEMAPQIFEYLTGRPFCSMRHQELRKMRIDPDLVTVPVERKAVSRLLREFEEARAN